MKKFLLILGYTLLVGAAAQVTANSDQMFMFVDTPYFLSDQVDTELLCREEFQQGVVSSVRCTPRGMPSSSRVKIVMLQSGERVIKDYPNVVNFTCYQGYCVDEQDREIGDASSLDPQRYYKGRIPTGHYLTMDDNNTLRAYMRGTGPLAAQYPRFFVETEMNTATPNGAWDIWCNPRGEYCYGTRDGVEWQLTREELPTRIPMAEEFTECALEFCYDTQYNVVGLNPDYSGWN